MKILLISGGKSDEHSISLKSAEFVIKHLQRHQVEHIIITKPGDFTVKCNTGTIAKCPFGDVKILKESESEFICNIAHYSFSFNIVFPILHGKFGEDGTIQGWLDLLEVPYVGCGVLSSAICMDKEIAKTLVTNLGINTAKHQVLYKDQWPQDKQLFDNIDYPVFVKPANSGSSIGVNKAKNKEQLIKFIEYALSYDSKILIEEAIECKSEISIAVLQNKNQIITGSAELVILNNDFYSYNAKYLDYNATKLITPATIGTELISAMKEASKLIFRALGCSGLARIDFLLHGENFIFMEINSMPGFTEISSFPLIFKKLGITFAQLLDILVENTLKQTITPQ